MAGFKALVGTLEQIKETAEQAERAIRGVSDAQSSLEQRAGDQAADMVAQRDRSGRNPFTAEQAESVKETLRATPESLRDALAPLLAEFGGGKGIGAGGSFTGGELQSLARLGFSPDQDQSPAVNERSARQFLDQNADRRRAINERDIQQRSSLTRRAVTDALSGGAGESQAGLNKLIGDQAESLGVNPEI